MVWKLPFQVCRRSHVSKLQLRHWSKPLRTEQSNQGSETWRFYAGSDKVLHETGKNQRYTSILLYCLFLFYHAANLNASLCSWRGFARKPFVQERTFQWKLESPQDNWKRGALGFSVLRFWIFFWSVFRFLCQKTSVFRFSCSMRFADFSFFSIWFSVFVKKY